MIDVEDNKEKINNVLSNNIEKKQLFIVSPELNDIKSVKSKVEQHNNENYVYSENIRNEKIKKLF